MIRKKGHKPVSANFGDRVTAELWGQYKQNLMDEIESFQVHRADLYTVNDIFIMKFGADSREYLEGMPYFDEYKDKSINILTYDELKKHCHRLLQRTVVRGGKVGTNSGRAKLPAPMTILRKFAYLSSAINHLISKGVDAPNECLKIVAYLRSMKENPYSV